MAQTVDVAQLALLIEDLCAPFAGEADGFGEDAEEFNDLSDVVVVFSVFRAGLRVEEVVAGDELEDLSGLGLIKVGLDSAWAAQRGHR